MQVIRKPGPDHLPLWMHIVATSNPDAKGETLPDVLLQPYHPLQQACSRGETLPQPKTSDSLTTTHIHLANTPMNGARCQWWGGEPSRPICLLLQYFITLHAVTSGPTSLAACPLTLPGVKNTPIGVARPGAAAMGASAPG